MPRSKRDIPDTLERCGIDTRKSKAALYRDAAEAGIEGRSKMTKAELVQALERHGARETARARS